MRILIVMIGALSLMLPYVSAHATQQASEKVEKKPNRDPDAAQLVTSDIDNFWKAYDAAVVM